MREREIKLEFGSPLGHLMSDFIQEKQSCGYKYEAAIHALGRLDRFLTEMGWSTTALPRDVIEHWISKRPYEQAGTHKIRVIMVRQFALYLTRQGYEAYVPETTNGWVDPGTFTPYIFSRREVAAILRAADRLPRDNRSPRRHQVMPEVFRLLYGCGMRISEVTHLRITDVDLDSGILIVRRGKFDKDRLVPMALSMTARLKKYALTLGARNPDGFFFPAPDGGPYSNAAVYGTFRRLLRACKIPHAGRGKGPRLHDLRHGFAVDRLALWYREGADLGSKLAVLATYMGHKSLVSTQRYLRITPEIFPEISTRLDQYLGQIIPRRENP
jgi:integrase